MFRSGVIPLRHYSTPTALRTGDSVSLYNKCGVSSTFLRFRKASDVSYVTVRTSGVKTSLSMGAGLR